MERHAVIPSPEGAQQLCNWPIPHMQLHSDTHTIRLGLLAGTTDDQDADNDGYDRDGVMRMINGSKWPELSLILRRRLVIRSMS